MKLTKRFKRAISLLLVAVIAISCLTVPTSADTTSTFTVFEGERKIDGWYPSFITQYMDSAKMDGFIQGIQHDGATIEVTYSGNADVSLLLQSYPVKEGSQQYPHESIGGPTVVTSGNRKIAVFKASELIKAYTSTKHTDDGSYLRLDNVLNFGIGGEGNTVYSVVVKWTFAGDPAVKINLSNTHQTVKGFGASYTWYGDWITMHSRKEEIFDWIFKDCGFNIIRFRDLQMVRAYGGGWEDTRYPAYKAYYDAAVKRGVDPIVVVTSWGQYNEADWCILSKDSAGNQFYTLKKDANGNYRYNDLAQFCVKSVQLFIDAGIPVDYFSISNEVELQQFRVDEMGNAREQAGFFLGTEETQYYCSYAKAYIAVYKAFQKAFGTKAPKLLAAETMAANPDLLKKYIDPIIKECPESVTDVAHHLYGSSLTAANFSRISDLYSDKYELWQTEWYNNDFLGHASVMIDEFVNENLNAYLYWAGYWVYESGAEGMHLIDVMEYGPNSQVIRRGNHYIMMHFSKFIKRGYIRVDAEPYASNSKAVAFKSPDGSELVLVLLNNSSSDEKLKLNIGAEVKSSECWRTTKKTDDVSKEATTNEYMKKLSSDIKDGSTLIVPAGTLTTYVLKLGKTTSSSEDEPVKVITPTEGNVIVEE